jgi:hypothetical protein
VRPLVLVELLLELTNGKKMLADLASYLSNTQ